jgi:hypothetical protein
MHLARGYIEQHDGFAPFAARFFRRHGMHEGDDPTVRRPRRLTIESVWIE